MKKQSYYYLNNRWRDWDSNITKSLVSDILAAAKENMSIPAKKLKVLDVGCGGGTYTFALEKKVGKVVGLEPYPEAYKQAIINKKKIKSRAIIKKVLVEEYKSKNLFDVVTSIATLEHMPHADKSFAQVFKLMKPGAILYLTVPNKLWPIEVHYKLPFLSWLPLPIANKYLAMTGMAKTYEDSSYAKTYWGIKKFFDQYPCTYTFRVPDANSGYLGLGDTSKIYTFVKNTGISLIKRWPIFWAFSKGFILVVKKTK